LIPLIARADQHLDRIAIVDTAGSHTYRDLLDASARIAAALLVGAGDRGDDLNESRVAFLVEPGFAWVATQWGIWRAGGVAAPLPQGSARPELEYYVQDMQASAAIFDKAGSALLEPIAEAHGLRAISTQEALARPAASKLPPVESSRRAMILYTSGTTNKPKGVVTTHDNITAQINALVTAWEWKPDDRILLVLPLHHVHGIINILSCALWSGAACEMPGRFDANAVWDRLGSGELTLFMAVPTVYVKLIAAWEAAPPKRRIELTRACSHLRLMVSGSAALPVTTLEKWKEISGHTLLERYGMTEIGMALSNALHGQRVPGSVGRPLPTVEVRLVNEEAGEVAAGSPGEIEVRGPSVFREYWNKPDATSSAFRNGWFRTGDMAVQDDGVYRILGRSSVDIIKTGGHKVSALEIEEELRQHPAISECAVVGVPDAEWGERVGAAIVLRNGQSLALEDLRSWCRDRLANYKLPSRLRVVDALPRNAMGKVTKPAVAKSFQSDNGADRK
jgi:malonyl-CoA/methylmalonyl-CoA synthetase